MNSNDIFCNSRHVDQNLHTIVVGNSYEKRVVQKHILRLEDNIKMDLKIVGSMDVDWFILIQNRIHLWLL
jgi:hypothetical protein